MRKHQCYKHEKQSWIKEHAYTNNPSVASADDEYKEQNKDISHLP